MIVPIFGTGQTGKSVTVTRQRHLNVYGEIQKDQDKAPLVFYGTPGTTLRKSFGDTPVRGWIAVGDLYYLVHRGTLYSVNNSGTATNLGTLNTTSGRVDMAYDGTVILMVDGTNGYTLTLPSTFAQIADADFPNGARTCTWLAGQFIVDDGDSDQFFISANGIAWDALDFATAESNPDGLVRVFADNGEVILAGAQTFEYWGNVGAGDFPFVAIQGATQEFGLAARWSLCKFNSGIAGLLKTRMGQVQVMFIKGYVPQPMSNQEMDSIINGYATVSDATAFSYMLGGHPMLQINFPTVMKSWLYDASTGIWTELEYGLSGERHRGELHLDYLNNPIIADFENGNIYNLEPDTYTDNGTAIAREIIGRHFFNANEEIVVDELYVDMQVGVGLTGNTGSSVNYLNLSGGYVSTQDSAALDITDDSDMRAFIAPTDWTPANNQRIGYKRNLGPSYDFYILNTLGNIEFYDGTTTYSSTSAPGFVNGTAHWVRFDRVAATGIGTFYTSEDGVAWTQLGSPVAGTAGTLPVTASELRIGSDGGASSLIGKLYKFQIRRGINGTLVANFDATTATVGASTVSATTGETYTLSGAATIAGTTVSATAGANPQAMLQVSKDNGHTWGAERWKTMGAIGKYLTRVRWLALGVARDWVFKLRVSDPVKFVLTFGALKVRG